MTCYHPLGQPPGQASPSGPGVGNCLKRSGPGRGVGGGADQKFLLFDFAKYVSFLAVYTMAADLKTTKEFFGEWLKRKNLSKLLHYGINYPSLNKLRKTFIKVVKTCRFAFVRIKKMYLKT